MIAEDPQIACPRRRVARRLGDGHRRHGAPGATFLFTAPIRIESQQLVEFAVGEADERQIIPKLSVMGGRCPSFRWIPARVRNPDTAPDSGIRWIRLPGGFPKIRPVAGEMPSQARQHTNVTRRNRKLPGTGPRPDSAGCRDPERRSTQRGERAFQRTNAIRTAWICCRCRKEKCCNTFESLRIQPRRNLGQRELPAPPRRGAVAAELAADLLPRHASRARPDQLAFLHADP